MGKPREQRVSPESIVVVIEWTQKNRAPDTYEWYGYVLRHSWATNALKRGVDPLTVALLMGHKDPSMLAPVYQHLSHSPEHMRDQARRATYS